MDYRSRILAAIDTLQRCCMQVDSDAIARCIGDGGRQILLDNVRTELRAMSKAGLVVFDRKARGWRRA